MFPRIQNLHDNDVVCLVFMNMWINFGFYITPHNCSLKKKTSNKYVVPKFNANIKLKLSLRWNIKYMVIKKLDSNRLGKLKTPSHSFQSTHPIFRAGN
jgi:hypothetical protein